MSKNHGYHWSEISALFRSSIRGASERRVGVEFERIGMWPDGTALHYQNGKDPRGESVPGAERLLQELASREGWPMVEGDPGRPIGLDTPLGKVSLEPGSQLEFSSLPAVDIDELRKTTLEFEKKVDAITVPWGLSWVGLGVNPTCAVEEMDVISSPRYRIMTEYLGKTGNLGTSMMRLTTSVQINLDYTSEREAIEMLQVALAVAPVSYALFANSPIARSRATGLLSYRGEIWRNTDKDRSGIPHEVFAKDFDFDRYAEWVWKRPLMFAQDRNGQYVAANGFSLEQINEGDLPGTIADANNQLSAIRQIFTEARLKPGYVEVRSVDGLRPRDRFAAVAFWLGILYDSGSRALVLKLLGGMTPKERDQAMCDASHIGLEAKLGKWEMEQVAGELVSAAYQALKNRGRGEERFLELIVENLEGSVCPADMVLRLFQGEWKGSIAPLVAYSSEVDDDRVVSRGKLSVLREGEEVPRR